LTHAYPQFHRDHVLFDLASVEGWAWYNWALENEPYSNLERATDGYIAQELDRMK